MRYLILGCNGMAGHMISIYLKENGHDVTGFAKIKSEFVSTILGDAFDYNNLKNIILNGKYDFIVNCIGVLNQDADNNKSNAVYLNSFLPHFIADITKTKKTQIIHISTDCVFSGNRGNYTEYDFKDGETFYDRSKALGEIVDTKNITLRNSIIGPDLNHKGIGLLNWFLQQDGEVYGYTKSIWTGQTTLQLAKTIEYVSTNKYYGIVNAVPRNSISKFELLNLINKHFKNNKINIKSVEGINANKSLIKTNNSFDFQIPDYENMIIDLANWISAHSYLYPHYNQL